MDAIREKNLGCLAQYWKTATEERENDLKGTIYPEPVRQLIANLNSQLYQKLTIDFQHDITLEQVKGSPQYDVFKNTVQLIQTIYSKNSTAEEITSAVNLYMTKNMRWGRSWTDFSKRVVGTLLCITAGILAGILGAAIGLIIGVASGASGGGLGALIVGIAGAVIGASYGATQGVMAASAALGWGKGANGSYQFFSLSPIEQNIHTLAKSINLSNPQLPNPNL